MKVTVVQPALPDYRLRFFESLREQLGECFSVYFSSDGSLAGPETDGLLEWQYKLGRIRNLGLGLYWQSKALDIPISRGDCIVIFGNPRFLSNIVLILKARFNGAKVVWWGHLWSSTSHHFRQRLRILLMRSCDAFLFYTDNEVDEYNSSSNRLDEGRVFALNNGIDIEPIVARRLQYDPLERARNALFIGRLTKKCNLLLALKAMQLPNFDEWKLHVVGWGEEGFHLRSLAEAWGLSSRIVWYGEMTDNERISEIANRCAIFVYPGAVGLSLIHALAYGLPAIVHSDRWRQMPEYAAFADDVVGRSFVCNDEKSLAAAIQDALSDVDRLGRWSRSAVALTATTFNVDDMCRRFCNVIDRVMLGK